MVNAKRPRPPGRNALVAIAASCLLSSGWPVYSFSSVGSLSPTWRHLRGFHPAAPSAAVAVAAGGAPRTGSDGIGGCARCSSAGRALRSRMSPSTDMALHFDSFDMARINEILKERVTGTHHRAVAGLHRILGLEDRAEDLEIEAVRDTYQLGSLHAKPRLVSQTAEWRRLQTHARHMKRLHLRDLMADAGRCEALSADFEGSLLDYSRIQVTQRTMQLLYALAGRQQLKEKIAAMFRGEKINRTEGRAVLHTALRASRGAQPVIVDGEDVLEQVHAVLDQVRSYSEAVRSGRRRGATGKLLRNIVAVGIGGSYLGPEFVHEAFSTEEHEAQEQNDFYRLRFLSNVDPVDVRRTLKGLDPEETLIIVISKSFNTAETMLNARTARQWLWDAMGREPSVVAHHVAACASTSAQDLVEEFGIPADQLFPFWDWVGGRYSVCSSVGALPLSLKYGFAMFEKFLAGARSVDKHFLHAPLERNLPVLMGLLGVWNMSFMGYRTRTILPYAEALLKLPAHIQQLCMESNGKRVTSAGEEIDYEVGQIDFGEPGTNGQHSFFQLLHMGQVVPAEFIGFIESQYHLHVEGEKICSHDELMANFFAQPDALAMGKTAAELRREGCPPELVPHRTFKGNRPSMSLLMPKLNAYYLGQILALYEHRTAVEGFMWDINSFDQWGVELGKKLASRVRDKMFAFRTGRAAYIGGLNTSTRRLLARYLEHSDSLCKVKGTVNHRSGVANVPVPPGARGLGAGGAGGGGGVGMNSMLVPPQEATIEAGALNGLGAPNGASVLPLNGAGAVNGAATIGAGPAVVGVGAGREAP